MLKNKRILLIIIIAIALFLIPSICNAAVIPATETTQTSTGKTVKWSYELNGEVITNLKCTNPLEVSGKLTIPSKIDGYTVVAIGNTKNTYEDGAFEENTGLTEVVIPDTVTQIGYRAFYKCTGLTQITLSENLTSIGEEAFTNCKISKLVLPENVTTLEYKAFEGCSGLKTVVMPKALTTIGERAFYNCTGITTITLPDALTTIESYAFSGCRGLKSIVIPNNVATIEDGAFKACSGLTSITLSNNITEIGNLTFSGCTGLTSIKIPESVTTIYNEYSYDGAFYECTNLTKVLIPDSVATISKDAFKKCDKLTIFGNDNQVSKRYAEENQIRFNYIANWDKVPEGGDITAPILKKLEIEYSTMFEYDKGTTYYLVSVGTNIAIKAKFDEQVCGNEAPKLTIKCGNGENIVLTNGTIQGEYIIYTYRIQDKDKGIITAISLTGGDIADVAGNKIEKYNCPELRVEYSSDTQYAFANGTGTITNNQGNGNNNSGNNGSNNGENSGDNQNNGSTITLSSIAITKAPTKVTYTEGEKFDKTGMVITAIYSNNSKKEITNYTISPSETLSKTDKKVVVSYTENGVTKIVEQLINVNAKAADVKLTSIAITKAPSKTNYTEGNTFSKTGMVVTATYSDGTKKEVTNYSVSPSGALKTTDKKVTITYTEGGVTKTVNQAISVARKVVKDDDTTTKGDSKLPQTGATLISLVLISLLAIAVISKVRYGKYKDI